jgi:hypothetical protein
MAYEGVHAIQYTEPPSALHQPSRVQAMGKATDPVFWDWSIDARCPLSPAILQLVRERKSRIRCTKSDSRLLSDHLSGFRSSPAFLNMAPNKFT